METEIGSIVLPGQTVKEAELLAKDNKKVVLGNGLRSDESGKVVVSKSGLLCKRKNNVFYVDSYQKRYVPAKNDSVIGIVQSRTLDFFWVDINCSELASAPYAILALSYLAFEGATKKNRPDINIGDLVYCKVVQANPDLEPELVCVDSTGKKGNLGELKDGFMFSCSINLVRKILSEKSNFLHLLSKECPYEIAAGLNGRIWIHSKSIKTTILLKNIILEAEHTPYNEMKNLVDRFASELTGIN